MTGGDGGGRKPPDGRPHRRRKHGDLFDYAASKAARDEGMDRADRAANPEWSAAMQGYTVLVCRRQRLFTSDDVWRLAIASGMDVRSTHEPRAFGPVMKRVAASGACRKAVLPPRNSSRRTLHASPRTVWESLVWEGQEAGDGGGSITTRQE